VEAVLDAPVAAIQGEPAGGIEVPGWQAAEQGDALGWLALDLAAQARGLGGEREAGLLGGDGGALQDAGFQPAFVAFAAAGQGPGRRTDLTRPGALGAGRWRVREKRPAAVPARGTRWLRAPWVDCL
jgi:hypothetical protein